MSSHAVSKKWSGESVGDAVSIGDALLRFDRALQQFSESLSVYPDIEHAVFAGCEEWQGLLSYKLLPHLGGPGCLVAAVAGGTNTGKSTVFNMLLGENTSPVQSTAAATCHPVIAANKRRSAECLDRKLVPEFVPRPLDAPENIVDHEFAPEILFVKESLGLPDHLILLDTPDVDSIDLGNWQLADNIRAAGDVLVAVLSGEKYKDERVVDFFRRAHAAGRIVLPLMNKADPNDDYAIARAQLAEFSSDLGLESPVWFVVAHDFSLARDYRKRPIAALQGTSKPLRAYLESLDVPAIKQRVYQSSVDHFANEAGQFLDGIASMATSIEAVIAEFEKRVGSAAKQYSPAPGSAVGGMLHAYIQARRGPVSRAIGNASRLTAKGVSFVGNTLRGALGAKATLEGPAKARTDDQVLDAHVQIIERITRDLLRGYFDSARNVADPAGRVLRAALDNFDLDAAVERVVEQTIKAERPSAAFQEHAQAMLDAWWEDHSGKRQLIVALDRILMITPGAIAIPFAIYAGGIGVPEAMIFGGPVLEQVFARMIEYQFGDAMFDFLSPWQDEQRTALAQALTTHVLDALLGALRDTVDVLHGAEVQEMRQWQRYCLTQT